MKVKDLISQLLNLNQEQEILFGNINDLRNKENLYYKLYEGFVVHFSDKKDPLVYPSIFIKKDLAYSHCDDGSQFLDLSSPYIEKAYFFQKNKYHKL